MLISLIIAAFLLWPFVQLILRSKWATGIVWTLILLSPFFKLVHL